MLLESLNAHIWVNAVVNKFTVNAVCRKDPVGPPPPYESDDHSVICQANIDTAGKEDELVVKCSRCNEVTIHLKNFKRFVSTSYDSNKKRILFPYISEKMNIPTLWRAVTRTCYQMVAKVPIPQYASIPLTRSMHCMFNNGSFSLLSRTVLDTTRSSPSSKLLSVKESPMLVPSCGMKIKRLLKLRCKHCYFVWRGGTRYVMCKAKPRHKQARLMPREEKSWILCQATQHPQRDW
ncbi:uncharacterized protein LOC124414471 [Diprion similis]|uniref:uncharacterized protein LOC124414471 n=1 Tax=Diprion similis TaxID=362088 RepID=UPI001EF7C1AB|nr:uncharacterized protein LOC124414471 [Diprion similis]